MKHLLFPVWIILAQISIDKRSVHAGGRNAVATYVVGQIVTSHRVGHRNHCAFAGGIGKAVRQPGRSRDGCQVENDARAVRFHLRYGGVNAVVITLHVHTDNAIEIGFACSLNSPNVRDTGIVHQDVDSALFCDLLKSRNDARLTSDITLVRGRRSSSAHDLLRNSFGLILVHIQDSNHRVILCELESDGASDTAAGAGDHRGFPVETEFAHPGLCAQRDTPPFLEMKSCRFFTSALGETSLSHGTVQTKYELTSNRVHVGSTFSERRP